MTVSDCRANFSVLSLYDQLLGGFLSVSNGGIRPQSQLTGLVNASAERPTLELL